jgi:hypothetical protein
MPIPVNQILNAEILLHGTIAAGGSNNALTVNSFHYRRTTNVNPVSKVNLDTIFQSTIVVPLGLALNVRFLQTFNTVRWVNDALDAPVQFNHAVAGAVAGDGMTAIEAAFILLRTALKGKSYRGGKHFGPLSEADTTLGTEDIFNAAAIVRWGAVVTALSTPLVDASGNTWVLEILSKKLSQLLINPTTVISNDVVSFLLNKRIGRLRRRERKSVY